MSSPDVSDAAAAAAKWRQAGPALADVRRAELRRMSSAEALAAAADLLDLLRYLPARQGSSGLVEQQRVFARLRG